jgi:antitoxin HicB
VRTPYSYPATLERDEDGRYVVRFPDLPEALTDGVDEKEALVEAADCLSEALASRIVDGEEIPSPSNLGRGQHLISPDPIIALKAALHTRLEACRMTIADLAGLLEMKDWHQAARLIDPKRPSKLRRLTAALDALGCKVEIAVVSQDQAIAEFPPLRLPKSETTDRGTVRLGDARITNEFPPLRLPKSETTDRSTVRLGDARITNEFQPMRAAQLPRLPIAGRCASAGLLASWPSTRGCGRPTREPSNLYHITDVRLRRCGRPVSAVP